MLGLLWLFLALGPAATVLARLVAVTSLRGGENGETEGLESQTFPEPRTMQKRRQASSLMRPSCELKGLRGEGCTRKADP